MKRSCKKINIKESPQIRDWVMECLRRHYKRYDFRHLLTTTGGLTEKEYRSISRENKDPLIKASYPIAEEAVRRIQNRNLKLKPVIIGIRIDKSTGKVRNIGKEEAMQQIFDHIAVGSCRDIFKRRIVPQQASSIQNRGQYYGTAMISRWIKADRKASAWAHRHGVKYSRKTKWYAKADVQKCYPSCRIEPFMRLFRRDCANEDILWLWETLLKSYRVRINGTGEVYEGFMIGALPSQWACQYMLSFAYRHIMGMHKERRGKKIKLVSHMLIFMDDFYISSTSKSGLKAALKELTRYLKDEFGLTIKPNWQILNVDKSPVDMMGFRIHTDGNVTVRPRVFLRARRMALKTVRKRGMCFRQAARMLSYKGFFVQNLSKIRKAKRKGGKTVLPLRCAKAWRHLHLRWAFKTASHMTRVESRRIKEHESNLSKGAAVAGLYAFA